MRHIISILSLPQHIYSVTVIVTDVTLHIIQAQHGSTVVVVAALVFVFGAATHLELDHLQNRHKTYDAIGRLDVVIANCALMVKKILFSTSRPHNR